MLCCICGQDLSHLPLPQAEAHVDACCDAKENAQDAHTPPAKAAHAVNAVQPVTDWLQVRDLGPAVPCLTTHNRAWACRNTQTHLQRSTSI